MTPERHASIKAMAESAVGIHHSPTILARMLLECCCEIEAMQATIDELRAPMGDRPERD